MGLTSARFLQPTVKFREPAEPSTVPFVREDDFTVSGLQRESIKSEWDLAMQTMITEQMTTRNLLTDTINKRVKIRQSAKAGKELNIHDISAKFTQWTEEEILGLHDIFQIFDPSDDGRIKIHEMKLTLTNLNDSSALTHKMNVIQGLDDGTGHLAFEDFLMLVDLMEKSEDTNELKITLARLRDIQRYMRYMSVVQQLTTGFL